MTPKEKADDLVKRYSNYAGGWKGEQCALIAVDETLKALEINQWQNKAVIDFYNEVIKEIENNGN